MWHLTRCSNRIHCIVSLDRLISQDLAVWDIEWDVQIGQRASEWDSFPRFGCVRLQTRCLDKHFSIYSCKIILPNLIRHRSNCSYNHHNSTWHSSCRQWEIFRQDLLYVGHLMRFSNEIKKITVLDSQMLSHDMQCERSDKIFGWGQKYFWNWMSDAFTGFAVWNFRRVFWFRRDWSLAQVRIRIKCHVSTYPYQMSCESLSVLKCSVSPYPY